MPLGTNVFTVALNLAASEHQTDLINAIKASGGEAIQTASGLCVKTSMNAAEFEKLIGEIAGTALTFEKIDQATDPSKLTPDVKAFLN